MSAKKIIIDGRGLRHSTGRYTRKILDYLQKIDSTNQYIVLVNPKDEPAWSPLKKSKNFTRISVPYMHYSISEQIGLARLLYSFKPDLVHYTMPQQPLFYFGKTVTTIHDLILLRFKNVGKSKLNFTIKQFIFRYFTIYISKKSKAILTPSNFSKRDIVSHAKVSPAKIVVTHLSADSIPGSPKSVGRLSGKKFIFYVGNAHVHKNLPRALQAFEELKKKRPDYHIAFAGNATIHYKRLQILAAAMEDADSIHILGRVSDGELKWLFQNAKVYLFPTLDEGFGLPGLEAMVYDLPVAASNASCLPEIYGDSVEYFDPLDPVDMANSINNILRNKRHAASLVKKGNKLLATYSWETAAQKTHDLYLDTLGR